MQSDKLKELPAQGTERVRATPRTRWLVACCVLLGTSIVIQFIPRKEGANSMESVGAVTATVQTKEDLEKELLREQIRAAREEGARRWWGDPAIWAAIVGGILAPIAFGIWSVVTGAWRAPLEEAELKSREESFNARRALLELNESRLRDDVAAYEGRLLAQKILRELGAYLGDASSLAGEGGMGSFMLYALREFEAKPDHEPQGMMGSPEELRVILNGILRSTRTGSGPVFGGPADRVAKLLETRRAWAGQLADAFPVARQQGVLPLQDAAEAPACPEIAASNDKHAMLVMFRTEYHRQLAFIENLRTEGHRLQGWLAQLAP